MQADYAAIRSGLRKRGLAEEAEAIEILLGQLYEAEEELQQLIPAPSSDPERTRKQAMAAKAYFDRRCKNLVTRILSGFQSNSEPTHDLPLLRAPFSKLWGSQAAGSSRKDLVHRPGFKSRKGLC